MGIPSYFSHVVRSYRKVIKKLHCNVEGNIDHNIDSNVDNLYLDSNSIIYDSFYNIITEDGLDDIEEILIESVKDKIEEYIRKVKPKNRLMIAFDGVAPIAKLSQQRSRRYKSWYQKRILEKLGGTKDKVEWDTASITPGTEFMSKLTKSIKKNFANSKKYGLKKIIVSSSDSEGEGEHKIFKYIRDNEKSHKNERTLIYGLDADLIMLSLSHVDVTREIYLYRETPHFIKSIDNTLSPNSDYVVDIKEFGRCLKDDLTLKHGMDTNVKDYVFICFMLGNDFMPHFPALNIRTTGIETLMSVYSECKKKQNNFKLLDDDGKIVWRNYKELLKILSVREDDLIKDEYKKRRNEKNRTRGIEGMSVIEDKLLKLPMRERDLEEYINPFNRGWEVRYYKELLDVDVDVEDERRKEICMNYLEGLEWTYKYYVGDCVDWNWEYKYDYPPLLKDLYKYVPYFETEFFNKKESSAVSPLVQLSYVVPRKSINLLPLWVVDKIGQDRIDEWYKDENEFVWAYCRYFWEGHVKMPRIDIEELKSIID